MDSFVKRFSSTEEYNKNLLNIFESSKKEKTDWDELHPPSIQTKNPIGRPRIIKLEQSEDEHVITQVPSKRTHIDWFSSPLIHDIMIAHSFCATGYETVKYLNRKCPKLKTEQEGRFDNLRPSTVDSWYDKDGKLFSSYQQKLKLSALFGPDKKKRTHFFV